ncbi:thiamine pyrophosphate enzyme [Polyplosphaeria fusca]|uniref:Pyruvate decarboxylase n=1 Tax=Polyplosphaeria fusca TaxID=682080 RepID=A0A9P4R425_9PLEO|nr:thiamine pyrophosphate enzyme [Polyplosphaeria fusca]
MPQHIKLAEYLFTRLRQIGVQAIHGVPGDFNLTLLDYVEPTGLAWIGNCNELNAGYAADGYARIKGIGALITTFGVGELSAINAIAGAYAERAAVVHIVGTPPRASQDSRSCVHHTFNDGDYRRFGLMAAHVTVAQTSLRDPRTSPEQIDEVLRQCLLHSRPVYIEVPVDLVSAMVSSEKLSSKIEIPRTEPNGDSDAAIDQVLEKLHAAKQPIILVDGEIRPLRIVDEVQKFIETTKLPTWTTSFAKGLLDETQPNMHGIYRGTFDDLPVKEFVDKADLVLCFGPHFSSTNSYAFSSIPKTEVTIIVADTEVRVGTKVFRDVPAPLALSQLLQKLDSSKPLQHATYQSPPQASPISFSSLPKDNLITQKHLWPLLSGFLRRGDILLAETGTAGYGARTMTVPPQTRFFLPVTWLSIGYMLPATQGAALAAQELANSKEYHGISTPRTILFIGDGSFQMTAQELSTIIREDLNVIVFLLNNGGYTIERCIHGLKQAYNDVAQWRYLEAPSFFGADKGAFTASAKNWGELDLVLKDNALGNGKGLRMVEVFMEKEDAPPGILTTMMDKQKSLVENGA